MTSGYILVQTATCNIHVHVAVCCMHLIKFSTYIIIVARVSNHYIYVKTVINIYMHIVISSTISSDKSGYKFPWQSWYNCCAKKWQ